MYEVIYASVKKRKKYGANVAVNISLKTKSRRYRDAVSRNRRSGLRSDFNQRNGRCVTESHAMNHDVETRKSVTSDRKCVRSARGGE